MSFRFHSPVHRLPPVTQMRELRGAARTAAAAAAKSDLNDPKTSYENAKKELIQAIQRKRGLDKQLVSPLIRAQAVNLQKLTTLLLFEG